MTTEETLTQGIQTAMALLSDHIDRYHYDGGVPENQDLERDGLRGIYYHLVGTLIAAGEGKP